MVFRMTGAWEPSAFRTFHLSSPLLSVSRREMKWEGGFIDSRWLSHKPGDRLPAAINSNPFIFVTKKERSLLSQVHLKQILLNNFKFHKNQSLFPSSDILWLVQLGWGTYPSTNHWGQEKWVMYKDGSSLLDPKDRVGNEASPQNEGIQVPKEERNTEKQHNKCLLPMTWLKIF